TSGSQSGTQTGQGGRSGSGTTGGAGGSSGPAREGGLAAPRSTAEGNCGPNDKPEQGIQGDKNQGTVNCGLTLLSELPGGGCVQGAGHCAYVRSTAAAYAAGQLKAYSLADPLKPVMTDMEPGVGGSESMRSNTGDGRSILVS